MLLDLHRLKSRLYLLAAVEAEVEVEVEVVVTSLNEVHLSSNINILSLKVEVQWIQGSALIAEPMVIWRRIGSRSKLTSELVSRVSLPTLQL